jgi:hypothetical protein
MVDLGKPLTEHTVILILRLVVGLSLLEQMDQQQNGPQEVLCGIVALF